MTCPLVSVQGSAVAAWVAAVGISVGVSLGVADAGGIAVGGGVRVTVGVKITTTCLGSGASGSQAITISARIVIRLVKIIGLRNIARLLFTFLRYSRGWQNGQQVIRFQ